MWHWYAPSGILISYLCQNLGLMHWSWESKLTLTFKAVKTLKLGPRSVELNNFLAFLRFFFQANYQVMLTSAVQKYLTLFVNIRISFSCFILFKCAWGADCCKQKIIFERILIDKNSALSTVQSLLKEHEKFKTHFVKFPSFITRKYLQQRS